ncbi:pitrilysin family protein [Rhodovulum sp. FJ3]|uniref:M16 family metallopeptidase n=1 Tax=Rhodovulum sp. FJ3 TaxID=3079053 RepID=UPI00293DAF39|nr:pitrilysin family protein [Rhodovulum sp. FJ3]MDV4168931.1 pitrilysin family protein [Rhodovulum sp. FJ3]
MIRRILISIALVFGALPAAADVDIQEVTSPGGITAWLVESPEIPFISMEIRFKGGAALDDPEKRGAVHLMGALLEEGAGDMDARAFAIARDSLAASFGYDVYRDAVTVSAEFLTETQDQAIDLLHQSLVDPRFDQDAIDRVRGQVISVIQSDATDPNSIAGQAFNRAAFGDHPYAFPIEGSQESLMAITRDDLFAAKNATMAMDRVHIGVVGDITADQLGPMLDRLFDGMPATGKAPTPDAEFALTGGVQVIPFDTPQSVVIFGHEGIDRDDPDFFAAFILNSILGEGGFGSRLMQEVREKRGLTYGVYTYLYSLESADLLLGQVASANDRVAEAVSVIRDEWARAAQDGVTAEELETAKTYLTGAYPLRFDGNGRIANILAGMQVQGFGLDYINTRNDRVNAVTLDDVNRMAARLLDAEALNFYVVGAPVGLETTN